VLLLIIKPKPLKKGDNVAIIAPASGTDAKSVENAIENVKLIGLNPVVFPTCYSNYGHLSAPDEVRANDVNDAFENDDIKGIICLRGGYGTPRILNMLNYEMIKANPKIFLGYSDITALHIAFNRICRMVTYHGPMAKSDFVKSDEDDEINSYAYESLKKNLFTNEPVGLYKNPDDEELKTLAGGKAEGELIGGNLTLLVATLGSPYELDAKGKILFIEEVGEPIYKIDCMLTSLALAGKFEDCRGIILGTFTNCIQEKKEYSNGIDLPLDTVLINTLTKFKKPIIANFRAGHNFPQPTIAFGTVVKMDADNGEIIFTESGNF